MFLFWVKALTSTSIYWNLQLLLFCAEGTHPIQTVCTVVLHDPKCSPAGARCRWPTSPLDPLAWKRRSGTVVWKAYPKRHPQLPKLIQAKVFIKLDRCRFVCWSKETVDASTLGHLAPFASEDREAIPRSTIELYRIEVVHSILSPPNSWAHGFKSKEWGGLQRFSTIPVAFAGVLRSTYGSPLEPQSRYVAI